MKTIWIVDAAYLLKAAPGRFDYLKLKTALESANWGAFFEAYYLNSTSQYPPTDYLNSTPNPPDRCAARFPHLDQVRPSEGAKDARSAL